MQQKTNDRIRVQFLGGAGTVTGSKIWIGYREASILIDCGLFQGLKKLRIRNWSEPPIDFSNLSAIVLTHAHLDHCGYLPVVQRNGFKGEIHSTYPTRDLTEIILKDSGKIQEEECERANRYGYTRHRPARPLYTVRDAERTMLNFVSHNYQEWVILNAEMKFRFLNSGHILGSAMVELLIGGKRFIFSGDLGRQHPLLMFPPAVVNEADCLVIESTYGDRQHPITNPKQELRTVIWDCYREGGILMIPTFAVERAQELLFLISQLKETSDFPGMPVYLDSPMGIDATQVLQSYPDWHRLDRAGCRALSASSKLIADAKASRRVVSDSRPKIVLAGSGMISGGRILHYLARHLDDKKNTILLTGFQAAGTRGRALQEGASEIKFFGSFHPVKAQIKQMLSLSSHADQKDILTWLGNLRNTPGKIFINHGEPHQADALRVKLRHELGWVATTAMMNEIYEIEAIQ